MADQPRVVILVPWRPGKPDREAAWAYCKKWWARECPDWPIYEGVHGADGTMFNRGLAINRAAALAESEGAWDVAVIIDADVLCDPQRVRQAVELAASSGGMVLPHNVRYDISAIGSARIMAGFHGNWQPFVVRTYQNMVSLVLAVPRTLWDAIGGFQTETYGWGFDDNIFAYQAETFGPPIKRLPGEVWHLWHQRAAEGHLGTPENLFNRALAARYRLLVGQPDQMRALMQGSTNRQVRSYDESFLAAAPVEQPRFVGTIPKILHRCVPAQTSPQVEAWWQGWCDLHPTWATRTWRDPIDPALFPQTAPYWPLARAGAQLADMVRLEALYNEGGIYLDSDVEPFLPLDALLPLPAFAAWEDATTIPNAVLGCAPKHPAIQECIALMIERLNLPEYEGDKAIWHAGPKVTTDVLCYRSDVLLLPPGSFYAVGYRDPLRKAKLAQGNKDLPWAFGLHHYFYSWKGSK